MSAALVGSGAAAQQTVKDFVSQTFIHGVPYNESLAWNSDEDVSDLDLTLADNTKREQWTNAVAVLGIAGNDRAFCPLIKFLNRGEADVGTEAFYSVPLALGYLVHSKRRGPGDFDSTQAMESALYILLHGVDPNFWEQPWPPHLMRPCGAAWVPFPPRAKDARRRLARRCVLGLVLTGHRNAGDKLDQLAQEVANHGPAEALFSGQLPAMLTTADTIASSGLGKYYENQ